MSRRRGTRPDPQENTELRNMWAVDTSCSRCGVWLRLAVETLVFHCTRCGLLATVTRETAQGMYWKWAPHKQLDADSRKLLEEMED